MKNHRFPWLRNRTTDNRKCEKARNIKGKRTIEMFSTASKPLVAHLSSASADLPRIANLAVLLRQNCFFVAGFPAELRCATAHVRRLPRRGEPDAHLNNAQASRARRSRVSDAPQFSKCNGDDRRLRRKQGGAVGAAASKTRVPPKARSGCWEPQPGGTFPAVLLRQNCFFVASFPAELRCTTAHVRRHSNHLYSPAQIFSNCPGLLNAHFPHPRYTVVENESEGSV